MPDDFDFATERYNEWLENQIENQRLKAAHRTCLPVGTCHYCGEPVAGDALFCDEACGKDFQWLKEREVQNG